MSLRNIINLSKYKEEAFYYFSLVEKHGNVSAKKLKELSTLYILVSIAILYNLSSYSGLSQVPTMVKIASIWNGFTGLIGIISLFFNYRKHEPYFFLVGINVLFSFSLLAIYLIPSYYFQFGKAEPLLDAVGQARFAFFMVMLSVISFLIGVIRNMSILQRGKGSAKSDLSKAAEKQERLKNQLSVVYVGLPVSTTFYFRYKDIGENSWWPLLSILIGMILISIIPHYIILVYMKIRFPNR
ncbi:hypothetical protein I6N95_26335 [Vagococcus sp. BWB3-3]|uniref:Uncharacterized protein n=1 Tax=Vagococcus allomyrinae TaxID=2794353 RepID=A0A940SZK9_9ENTE|nr:hypothetical protein [Vagococcus allomyrinae]MBP1044533.1 hypothetical protein [Vagococcus allomyrinae]